MDTFFDAELRQKVSFSCKTLRVFLFLIAFRIDRNANGVQTDVLSISDVDLRTECVSMLTIRVNRIRYTFGGSEKLLANNA